MPTRRPLLLVAPLLTAALGIVSGCAGKARDVSGVGPEARRAISHAATARYPGPAAESPDVQLTAINYPTKHYLEIHNPGSQSIPRSTVWVNGTFLTMIDGIAPGSFVKVEHANLLEAGMGANDLRALKQPVKTVEIETTGGLYAVQGPTIKR